MAKSNLIFSRVILTHLFHTPDKRNKNGKTITYNNDLHLVSEIINTYIEIIMISYHI